MKREVGEKRVDNDLSKIIGLVGKDCLWQSNFFEGREHFWYAGVGLCIVGPASAVFCEHKSKTFIEDFVGDAVGGQGAFYEVPCSVADKVTVGICRVRGQAQSGEGGVHRVCKVVKGVKQCAVKVK